MNKPGKKITSMKHFLLLLFLASRLLPAFGEFNPEPYKKENTASFSEDYFYPERYKQTDPITISNIFREFKNRYEFFVGIGLEPTQNSCFKLQNKADKWLKRLKEQKSPLQFKWIDDELLFNEESPLNIKIRPGLIKPDDRCSYVSYADPGSEGGIFCKFHGPDPRSSFYQRHIHKFVGVRPFITAYDVTEILIFFPFMLVIPISWLILKKILGDKA